jgi:hypothetical protein
MATKTKTTVDDMAEGEFLVRGTQDPMEALRLVVDVMHENWTQDMLDGVAPGQIYRLGQGLVDNEPNQDAIDYLAAWLYGMLEAAQPGLYRKVNCLPGSFGEGEGWRWQLGFAKTKGPGVFEGVLFPPVTVHQPKRRHLAAV